MEPEPPSTSVPGVKHGTRSIKYINTPSTGMTAQHWHNTYATWQKRVQSQNEEAAKIEAQQIKLFGGEPGDDVALCYRMLEFFGKLDFIDT